MTPSAPVSVLPLSLDGELTVYRAVELKSILCDALARCTRLDLDLAGAAEIDTAGLQLLILLKREAQLAGKELRVVAHGETVREVIEFANLAAFFGDPLFITAGEMAVRSPGPAA